MSMEMFNLQVNLI